LRKHCQRGFPPGIFKQPDAQVSALQRKFAFDGFSQVLHQMKTVRQLSGSWGTLTRGPWRSDHCGPDKLCGYQDEPTTYLRSACRLLQEAFGDEEVDWSVLNAGVITDFVRREAAKFKPSACGQPITAVRSLIRFLASQGVVLHLNRIFRTFGVLTHICCKLRRNNARNFTAFNEIRIDLRLFLEGWL
jgi:hypothetical protein